MGRKNSRKQKEEAEETYLPTDIIERSDRLSGAWLDKSIAGRNSDSKIPERYKPANSGKKNH